MVSHLSPTHTRLCSPWLWQPAVGHALIRGLHTAWWSHTVLATRLAPGWPDVYAWSFKWTSLRSNFSRINKTVTCVVTDSRSESEDKLFLHAVVAESLQFTWQSQTKEQKIRSNRIVRHFVWPSFSRPFHQSALIGLIPYYLKAAKWYYIIAYIVKLYLHQ